MMPVTSLADDGQFSAAPLTPDLCAQSFTYRVALNPGMVACRVAKTRQCSPMWLYFFQAITFQATRKSGKGC